MAAIRVTPSALHDHASRLQRAASDVLGATGRAHGGAMDGAQATGHPEANARAASFWSRASTTLGLLAQTTHHVGERLHAAADGYVGTDDASARTIDGER